MPKPSYTVMPGRHIYRDGVPFVSIHREGGTRPHEADDVTHVIAKLLNEQPGEPIKLTYVEIMVTLTEAKLDATASSLDRAVEEEKEALFKMAQYKKRDGGRAARVAAEEFYAEDICDQLNQPDAPTPNRLLDHRRFATAWAVAEVMRTNGLV